MTNPTTLNLLGLIGFVIIILYRHTYATLLLANGVDIKTVVALLGDIVDTVVKTYIHFTDEMRQNAHNAVANIF